MTSPTPTPLLPGGPRPIFTRYIKLTIKPADVDGVDQPAIDFECQVTNASVVSAGGSAVTLTTLCPGGTWSEATESTYSLDITGVQDVESLDSLMLFLWEHSGEIATATYYPKVDSTGKPQGRGFRGDVTLALPNQIGGVESGNYATFTSSFGYQGGKPDLIDDQGNVVAPGNPAVVATDAMPGSPGYWLPSGAANPDTMATAPVLSTAAWAADQFNTVGTGGTAADTTWNATAWVAYAGPHRDRAKPADSFPSTPEITASDATNAAKLAGLGFSPDAANTGAWVTATKMTVHAFDFHWSGAAWVAGAA